VTDLPIWKFSLLDRDGAHVVALAGELDLDAADTVRRTLIDQLDRPPAATVVADLTGVTFVDSAALGALIGAYRHAADRGRRFVVTGAAQGVRRVMQIAGVYDLLSGATPVPEG
jgi:anti-anti-sigma factor